MERTSIQIWTLSLVILLVVVSFARVEGRGRCGGWSRCGSHHRHHQNLHELGGFRGFDDWLNPNVNSIFRQIEKSIRSSLSSDQNDYNNTGGSVYSVTRNNETGFIEISIELPGVLTNDMNVELEDQKIIRIKGKKRYYGRTTDHREEYTTSFHKVFRMVDELEVDSIQVTLSDGILHIQAKPKIKDIRILKINNVINKKQYHLNDTDEVRDSVAKYNQTTAEDDNKILFDFNDEEETASSISNTVDFEYDEF